MGKIIKRPDLKGITLAKFLKEIKIWERDGQGNPVKDSAGKQKKMNLTGLVKIRRNKSANILMNISNQPIIELENGKSTVILSSLQEKEDKIIKVEQEVPESLLKMLEK